MTITFNRSDKNQTLVNKLNTVASQAEEGVTALATKQDALVSGTNIKTVNGTSLLGSGNVVVSGSAAATTVEQDLGSTPTWRGKFTITDAAITAAAKVLCWQAPGPYTGKGTLADEAEKQPVQVIAVVPGSGSAVVHWQTPPMIAMVKETQQGRRNTVGATFDRVINQRHPEVFTPRRLGKVRGNVKFSYTIFT